MRDSVADILRCHSTPVLHGLPDLRGQHNFRLSQSPSAFLYQTRRAPGSRRRPVKLLPRLLYPNYDSIAVDGRAVEEFNTALEEMKSRPKLACNRINTVMHVLESLSAELDKYPPSIGNFRKKRNLYACCLNFIMPKLSDQNQTANLLASLFRRYDDAALGLVTLFGAEQIRASDACDQELIHLRSQLKQLQQELASTRKDHEIALKRVQETAEAKRIVETELELYRKYVFVKTGKRTLDWATLIPDGRLPTIEYMRSEHPTRAALLEAQIETARRSKELEYVKPEEPDDDETTDLKFQLQKSAINDAFEDLDSIARRIAELWGAPVNLDANIESTTSPQQKDAL